MIEFYKEYSKFIKHIVEEFDPYRKRGTSTILIGGHYF